MPLQLLTMNNDAKEDGDGEDEDNGDDNNDALAFAVVADLRADCLLPASLYQVEMALCQWAGQQHSAR